MLFIGLQGLHLLDTQWTRGIQQGPGGLCQFYGVSVTPTKLIRPPISRALIEKYCMPRQAQQ